MKKDENHVKRVVVGLKLWLPGMLKKERPLVNVCGGALASDEIVGNVLSSKNTGEYVMAKSVT